MKWHCARKWCLLFTAEWLHYIRNLLLRLCAGIAVDVFCLQKEGDCVKLVLGFWNALCRPNHRDALSDRLAMRYGRSQQGSRHICAVTIRYDNV